MKLEQQCISLSLAKRLKELGVKQESLFSWYKYTSGDMNDGVEETFKLMQGTPHKNTSEVSAFTVAELGEMLPNMVDVEGNASMLRYCRNSLGDRYGMYGSSIDEKTISIELITAPTEAEARGLMVAYLLENKLI